MGLSGYPFNKNPRFGQDLLAGHRDTETPRNVKGNNSRDTTLARQGEFNPKKRGSASGGPVGGRCSRCFGASVSSEEVLQSDDPGLGQAELSPDSQQPEIPTTLPKQVVPSDERFAERIRHAGDSTPIDRYAALLD